MIKVSPSILSADFVNLERDIRALSPAGADYVHIDVMDGEFVPNITIGIPVVAAIRKITELPLDVHLMIENPGEKVDWFLDAGADIVYIHPESERYVVKTLAHIKSRGAAAGIAINPDTSLATDAEPLRLRHGHDRQPRVRRPEVHPVHQEQGACAGRAEGKRNSHGGCLQ